MPMVFVVVVFRIVVALALWRRLTWRFAHGRCAHHRLWSRLRLTNFRPRCAALVLIVRANLGTIFLSRLGTRRRRPLGLGALMVFRTRCRFDALTVFRTLRGSVNRSLRLGAVLLAWVWCRGLPISGAGRFVFGH